MFKEQRESGSSCGNNDIMLYVHLVTQPNQARRTQCFQRLYLKKHRFRILGCLLTIDSLIFFPSVYVSISSVQMFLLFLSNTDTTDSDMQKNLLKAHKAQLNSATDALNQRSCTAVQK